MESKSKMMKHCGVRVSVVIPARNEAKNLPYVLPLIPSWVHEVILVNDHSTDDTVETARKLLPTIRIVNTQEKHGKGVALRTGFRAARGDIIITMDADGSSDPREIPHFIEALLAGAYFVIGSRFTANGGSADFTPLRRLGARMLISLANRLFRMNCTDMFCGMNAFWRDCLDYFEIDCVGFEVETLMALRVRKANLEIAEVPSYEYARIHGDSHFHTFRDGWRVLKMMLQEWANGRSVTRTIRMRISSQWENIEWSGALMPNQIEREVISAQPLRSYSLKRSQIGRK